MKEMAFGKYIKIINMRTTFLVTIFVACVLFGCSSSETNEGISIAGTEWVSVENGTTGDADEIISGEQRGACFRIGISKIDIFQNENGNLLKCSGSYKYDHPNIVMEMDNGAMATYSVSDRIMSYASGDEYYEGIRFMSKMYLCTEGESTYKKTLIDILVGKWKLSRMNDKGSNAPFYSGIWNNDRDMEESLNKLNRETDFFTIEFGGYELNGELMEAEVSGKGTNASISGTWNADMDSRSLSISFKSNGSEKDALGKVFMSGLKNVYGYDGDGKYLSLYFKDGGVVRVIGFTRID